MTRQDEGRTINRRRMLKVTAASRWLRAGAQGRGIYATRRPADGDEAFLDDLERQACLFFWEQGSPHTGQVLDRARNDLGGARDPRRMASIAASGFGLTALCIADRRGYLPHAQIVERVKNTLSWHLNTMPEVHGFFFHFTDIETGKRWSKCELSTVDTSLLLCGILTAKAYFEDPAIQASGPADLRAC